ncbi:MAG TPA: histidine kinase, partial [Cyanobacteria bacterium UBA11149]|nr:histidine kinase [Cyanobacteria bacterium UBA11149]
KDIRSSFDPEKFFQTAVNQIGEAFKVDRCLVHIYLESPTPHIPLVAEYKRPEITEPWVIDVPVIGNPHAVRILSQDAAIVCHDVDKEPLLKGALHLCHQVGLKSMVGVRTSYQGKPNGMIGIHQYHYPRQWLDEEISLLEAVAGQLGIAIAQANLLTMERQRRIELDWHNKQLSEEIRIRQYTEEALRKSEQRWQLVLNGNNDGIYDWDITTGYAFLSTRIKTMLGYEDSDLINHVDTWRNLLHPEDFQRVIASQKAYLEKKSPQYLVEYRLRCKDGNYKWILARGQALWD